MAYAFITYAQACSALAAQLYNSGQTFFANAELKTYLLEALQTFNALANFYRREFTFPTRSGVTWYDLTDATNLPNTLRPLSTPDTSILNAIEYHILEPQTVTYPLAWTGSRQFTLSDILDAIEHARDGILSDAGCTISQSLVAATPGRIFLPDTAIDVRRVTWIPVSGFGFTANTLMPSDAWADQSFTAGFPQASPGYPSTYRRSTEPPLSFDVDIQPAIPGQYDVLTTNAGVGLDVSAPATLTIPTDWCWAAKWAALQQLMGMDSAAADPFRAAYCDARVDQAVADMKMAPALLAARINDVPVVVESVTNGDFYSANWQARAPGTPTELYYAGMNMIGLAPIPNGVYSVTASVVANMILPFNGGDYIQVGREDIGVILDYAQHLALFKCGGAEFAQTMPLLKRFMAHCATYNAKLRAVSSYLEFLDGRSRDDARVHPSQVQEV